ncbi:MAG TPA: spore coat protein U domain-containing protein, partial [Thermosynechococcus sp. M98_K2018_005]
SATKVWGCDVTTDVERKTINASAEYLTIYGRIPAGGDLGMLDQLVPGTYTDIVQVIVSF